MSGTVASEQRAAPRSYGYRAINSAGSEVRGQVVAATDDGARASVERQGLLPLSITARGFVTEHRAPLGAAELALGLRILADLLAAEMPLTQVLRAFDELAPEGWRPALVHLRTAIREGSSFASALSNAPIAIPALVIGIAEAGEAGAGLSAAMMRAAELTESTAAMRSAVASALAYPAVLAFAGVASIGVLIGVVLPRFATILEDVGQNLPASTQFVLRVSMLFRQGFIPVLVAGAIALTLVRAWIATERGRLRWHELLLRVPGISAIRFGSASARAAGSMATLLDSGVPIRRTMALSARAAADAAIEVRLHAAGQRIVAGQGIAASCAAENALTPLAVRLIRAGEESGRVSAMLSHASRLEQEQADRRLRSAVRMLEPILIMTFAGIVAFVAASLLQAVYSIRPGT